MQCGDVKNAIAPKQEIVQLVVTGSIDSLSALNMPTVSPKN